MSSSIVSPEVAALDALRVASARLRRALSVDCKESMLWHGRFVLGMKAVRAAVAGLLPRVPERKVGFGKYVDSYSALVLLLNKLDKALAKNSPRDVIVQIGLELYDYTTLVLDPPEAIGEL